MESGDVVEDAEDEDDRNVDGINHDDCEDGEVEGVGIAVVEVSFVLVNVGVEGVGELQLLVDEGLRGKVVGCDDSELQDRAEKAKTNLLNEHDDPESAVFKGIKSPQNLVEKLDLVDHEAVDVGTSRHCKSRNEQHVEEDVDERELLDHQVILGFSHFLLQLGRNVNQEDDELVQEDNQQRRNEGFREVAHHVWPAVEPLQNIVQLEVAT